MDNKERDTHFLGFARLQMPELDSLFASLYQAYATGNHDKRDEYSQRIQTRLAQSAYDLAQYVRNDLYSRSYEIDFPSVNDIPDLTEWPDTP
jgi:hypothetical protein